MTHQSLQILLITLGTLLPLAGYLSGNKFMVEIIRDLRVPRILHYVASGGLGLSLYLRQPEEIHQLMEPEIYFSFAIFALALSYSAVFAIITNNIADLEGDRISNPERPLVMGRVNKKSYLAAGIVSLLISLCLSLSVQLEMFLCILTISICYFIYSCQPFRLKRIPFLSKFIIGFNSFLVTLCGFEIAGGNWEDFPITWAIFILIPLSLAANFVDLKDTEGDRKMGVATFPVLFGERNARIVISIFTLAAYAMAGILLNISWVYPLNALMAILHIWLLWRKPYDEKLVFFVYVTSIAGLDVFLFFSENIY